MSGARKRILSTLTAGPSTWSFPRTARVPTPLWARPLNACTLSSLTCTHGASVPPMLLMLDEIEQGREVPQLLILPVRSMLTYSRRVDRTGLRQKQTGESPPAPTGRRPSYSEIAPV
jgi:hypothetical protein